MPISTSRPSLRPLLAVLFLVVPVAACASGPDIQNQSPEEVFARAEARFENEEWGDAAELLDRLLLTWPGFEQGADAQFMLAEAYYNDEKYITAQQEFTRFIDRYPGDLRAPEAALGVCRSYSALSPIPQRDQEYTERAMVVCQNVYQDWAGIEDEVAERAREITNGMRAKLARKVFANAEFYASRDFWDSAIIYYEFVVENYADTEWAPTAISRIMDAYAEIGYDEEVAEWRERLLNSYPDSPEAQALGDATAENGDDGGNGSGSGAGRG